MKQFISAFIGFIIGVICMFIIAKIPDKQTRNDQRQQKIESQEIIRNQALITNYNLVKNSYPEWYVSDIFVYSDYISLHLYDPITSKTRKFKIPVLDSLPITSVKVKEAFK